MKIVNESLQELNESQMELFGHEVGVAISKEIEREFGGKTNEGIALLMLSSIFASPAIIKLMGMAVKKGAKLITGKKNSAGDVAGEGLKRFADKMHHKLTQPIEWTLKKMGMSDGNAHKGAKVVHGVLVAFLGIASGIELARALEVANISKSTVKGALATIEGTETGVHLIQTLESMGMAATRALGIIK